MKSKESGPLKFCVGLTVFEIPIVAELNASHNLHMEERFLYAGVKYKQNMFKLIQIFVVYQLNILLVST